MLPASASPDSHRLFALARRVLEPFIEVPNAACAMVAGSVAEGLADDLSDLDLMVYYDAPALPPAEALDAVRVSLGGGPMLWSAGAIADGAYVFAFKLDGVECQIVHSTIAQWESDIAAVLEAREIATPQHKAMYGTLTSVAIVGGEHVDRWQRRLAEYSEPLRRAMIEQHLKFFPIWRSIDRLTRRDADLWIRQALVDSSFNLLAVLAGLNRKYFTSFQFKRMRAFEKSLSIAPARLIDRLEGLWNVTPKQSAEMLRELVAETVSLVEQHAPEIDTAGVRKSLG